MVLPGDNEWLIRPKWFVAATVVAVLAVLASYDLDIAKVVAVPVGVILLFRLYIAIRFRRPRGERGMRTLHEQLRESAREQTRNRRRAAKSSAKGGSDPV